MTSKFATGHRPAKLYDFNGKQMTAAQIASATGLTISAVWRRMSRGTPLDAPKREERPRRKIEKAIPMPRAEVISGLLSRASDPESHETLETLLVAAYNAGAARSESI